jgi:hypothetical protein
MQIIPPDPVELPAPPIPPVLDVVPPLEVELEEAIPPVPVIPPVPEVIPPVPEVAPPVPLADAVSPVLVIEPVLEALPPAPPVSPVLLPELAPLPEGSSPPQPTRIAAVIQKEDRHAAVFFEELSRARCAMALSFFISSPRKSGYLATRTTRSALGSVQYT